MRKDFTTNNHTNNGETTTAVGGQKKRKLDALGEPRREASTDPMRLAAAALDRCDETGDQGT
eukprot:UN18826